MKIKVITRPLKLEDRYNLDASEEVALVVLPSLNLGNNFSLDSLFKAMFESMNSDQMDLIRNISFDEIKLSANINHGRLMETMCAFDFYCYFNPIYELALFEEGYI